MGLTRGFSHSHTLRILLLSLHRKWLFSSTYVTEPLHIIYVLTQRVAKCLCHLNLYLLKQFWQFDIVIQWLSPLYNSKTLSLNTCHTESEINRTLIPNVSMYKCGRQNYHPYKLYTMRTHFSNRFIECPWWHLKWSNNWMLKAANMIWDVKMVTQGSMKSKVDLDKSLGCKMNAWIIANLLKK